MLGIDVDSIFFEISIPAEKLKFLNEQLIHILHSKTTSLIEIQRVYGKLIHLAVISPAFRAISRSFSTVYEELNLSGKPLRYAQCSKGQFLVVTPLIKNQWNC